MTGQNGHNWRGTTPLLRKILEDTGKFEVRVTEEFRGAGPETLAPYDLVVLNYFERGRPELRWGEKTNAAFLDYVRSGKGVVVYHFSTAAFDGWTEYEKISGGNWRPNNGHHSAPHNFVVDVKDHGPPDHQRAEAVVPAGRTTSSTRTCAGSRPAPTTCWRPRTTITRSTPPAAPIRARRSRSGRQRE